LDRRLGVAQPPGYPFSLNSAVDKLLKKEFDYHRSNGTAHPLMVSHGLNLVPFSHNKIDEWRDALGGGIQYQYPGTNLIITGAVDDIWTNSNNELSIVDYKATSKDGEVDLDSDWQIGYKRQMEVYQWLFRKNNFKVSDVGYFVYCNGDAGKDAFDSKLEFEVKVIPYKGKDNWVDEVIKKIHRCLASPELPGANPECDFCAYRRAASMIEERLLV
jgi:hypothetical protein